MTRPPRASLGKPIEVHLPKPRTATQLMHDPHAVRIHTEVVERLAEFVHTKKANATVVPIKAPTVVEERAS